MRVASILSALSITGLFFATACGDDAPANNSPDGGSGGTSSGGSGGSTAGGMGGAGNEGGEGGSGGTPEPKFRSTATGEVTWQLTFDEDAITAGAVDCSYTRTYTAVQDESAPWVCPTCEIVFVADVEMTAGKDDCYTQITDFEPAETEWFGWGNGTFYRGSLAGTVEQGTVAVDGETTSVENQTLDLEFEDGGTYQSDMTGSFTLVEESGDPKHGFNEVSEYECGWPKSDAPEYTGNYRIEVGETIPDGYFLDKCGQPVRLHDFKGNYLLIDMSALDCPACQQMAGGEPLFSESMENDDVPVKVITLMAPSLGNTLGETSTNQLELWADAYEIDGPILADRGWGLAMFLNAIIGDIGYPSWVLVNPDLEVMTFNSGFLGWGYIRNTILMDAEQ